MFRRLRVKLTFMYAGLFCLALLLIGAVAYFVIAGNTQKLAEQQLANTARAFERVWDARLEHLTDAAARTANAPGLAEAIDTRNDALIRTHLADLRARSNTDIAFVVTREGLVITETGASSSVSPGMQMALNDGAPAPGVLRENAALYQAAAAALPGNAGWVVTGARLGSQQMDDVRALSPIPVQVSVIAREDQAWRHDAALASFIEASVQAGAHAGAEVANWRRQRHRPRRAACFARRNARGAAVAPPALERALTLRRSVQHADHYWSRRRRIVDRGHVVSGAGHNPAALHA